MGLTAQDIQAITNNKRIERIICKLLQAADDICAMKNGQITIHVGEDLEQVKVVVPKQY